MKYVFEIFWISYFESYSRLGHSLRKRRPQVLYFSKQALRGTDQPQNLRYFLCASHLKSENMKK